VTSLNVTWAKYGCYKCNNYKLLILEVNVLRGASEKSDFQNYINKNTVQYPAVWHGDGGTLFGTATGNGTSGNPEYLIKPDKTFKKDPSVTDINTAGGNVQHVCGTGDQQAPSVSVTAPASGAQLKVGAQQTITWTATDNVGVV